jgi:hypothetical protein
MTSRLDVQIVKGDMCFTVEALYYLYGIVLNSLDIKR